MDVGMTWGLIAQTDLEVQDRNFAPEMVEKLAAGRLTGRSQGRGRHGEPLPDARERVGEVDLGEEREPRLGETVAAGMLLQQRPTRRVLSCATAKLLRDEAESMVPNIDPEQVRKLAGWGLTQNDIASFVGWSQSLISLGF